MRYKNSKSIAPSRMRQGGFSVLLVTILTGVAVAGVTMGLVDSINGTQSSVVANHALTQAQIRAAAAYQALGNVVNGKKFDALESAVGGTISSNAKFVVAPAAECPSFGAHDLCFDITASSGEANAVVRTLFTADEKVESSNLPGSVFAGGLIVNKDTNLTGDTGSIVVQTGQMDYQNTQYQSGVIVDTNGQVLTDAELAGMGLKVEVYEEIDFASPASLKNLANYIYFFDENGAQCEVRNLPSSAAITEEQCLSYVTPDFAARSWSLTTSAQNPPGVFWFDGTVKVLLKESPLSLVNTVIATENLSVIPEKSNGTYLSYAGKYYQDLVLSKIDPLNAADVSAARKRICGDVNANNRPVQYCDSTYAIPDVVNAPEGMDPAAISLANILFLSGGVLSLDAKGNSTTNFYGNLLATYGSGGTGSPSAKFTGTGTLNITGNIVVAGTADVTQMTGNIKINLKDTDAGNIGVPVFEYYMNLHSIKYM